MYFLPSKVKESLVLLRKIIGTQSNTFCYLSVCWFFCHVRKFLSTAYSFFQQWKQRFVLLALLVKLNNEPLASTNGLNIFFFLYLEIFITKLAYSQAFSQVSIFDL